MKNKINLNKTILMAFTLNIIQLGTVFGTIVYAYVTNGDVIFRGRYYNWYILAIMFTLVTLLNCFFTIRDIHILKHNELQYGMLKDSIEEVENLNKTLRAQRHDFMNHLQVVYGLMEMEDYKEATEYIEKVFNDIQKVSRVLKTSNAAINALLQAKILFGEKRGITTKLNITTQLKDLKMPSWEFCRVLGNIIDNAIYALQEIEGERVIEIDLYEDLKNYGFRIKNNGPQIPNDLIGKIFEAGVTTKGDRGTGMGLAISKELVNEYGGELSVSSSEEKTVFKGYLPR